MSLNRNKSSPRKLSFPLSAAAGNIWWGDTKELPEQSYFCQSIPHRHSNRLRIFNKDHHSKDKLVLSYLLKINHDFCRRTFKIHNSRKHSAGIIFNFEQNNIHDYTTGKRKGYSSILSIFRMTLYLFSYLLVTLFTCFLLVFLSRIDILITTINSNCGIGYIVRRNFAKIRLWFQFFSDTNRITSWSGCHAKDCSDVVSRGLTFYLFSWLGSMVLLEY